MKKLFAISWLSICTLFLACGNGGTPQPTKLSLSFYGDSPSSYDCNNESRFEVSFAPYNKPQLSGDHLKMFFRLQIGEDIFYGSNDIDFPISESGDHNVYTLEFGGAIEGEYLRPDYDIIGYLALVQGGEITDYTYTGGSYISVTPKTSFSKTMHIEYDCQEDCGLPSEAFAKLSAAFHVADTDTNFLWDELNLPEEWIDWDNLWDYHWDHFSNTSPYNIHLLAVTGLEENPPKEMITGASMPGPYGFSYVFVADINYGHPGNELNVMVTTAVHELGHQRGNLTHASGDDAHPENHDSPFCAMNQDISCDHNNDNNPYNDPPGLVRWFDINPHFCDMCVNTIKSVSW